MPKMSPISCAECNELPLPGKTHKKYRECHETSYCSTACQKSGWRLHKLYCGQLAKLITTTPRPSPEHKIGFLLPDNDTRPRAFWIRYPKDTEDDIAEIAPYLGDSYSGGEQKIASRYISRTEPYLQKYNLKDTTVIW